MKLTKQKNFRVTETESRGAKLAAFDAGITESQFFRLLLRAALGETQLLEQLSRAAAVARTSRRAKTRKRKKR